MGETCLNGIRLKANIKDLRWRMHGQSGHRVRNEMKLRNWKNHPSGVVEAAGVVWEQRDRGAPSH